MSAPEILVMVGTHHRPFPRLVHWADRLAQQGVGVLVQYGASAPPRVAAGVESLTPAQMQRLSPKLKAVVCQGGPSLVMEWLRRGHMPIVVPRDPALGEHIDSHQQLFADFLAHRGWVRLACDYPAFGAACRDHMRSAPRVDGLDLPDTGRACAAFERLADAACGASAGNIGAT